MYIYIYIYIYVYRITTDGRERRITTNGIEEGRKKGKTGGGVYISGILAGREGREEGGKAGRRKTRKDGRVDTKKGRKRAREEGREGRTRRKDRREGNYNGLERMLV